MRSGQVIANRYRLMELVGSGGSGLVWLAMDEVEHRMVALKRPHSGAGPDLRGELEREAGVAAQVAHPGAIAVFEVADDGSDAWLVMEYFQAGNLSEVMRERGPLEPLEVARIGVQAADALAAMHRVGVVHRDVTPNNVLLHADGTVKVTDYGISVWKYSTTSNGKVSGTAAYMSPEVADGRGAMPSSDVFSLGASLFAAVEGEPPFGFGDQDVLARIRAGHHGPIRRAGPLAPVLEAMLQTDPAARPTATETTDMLAKVVAGEPVPAPAREFMVQIYLESAVGASEVDRSVLNVLRELGADHGVRPPPVTGSWFRGFKARTKKIGDSDPFSDLARRLERALEITALHGPQAQIDSAQGGAAADLIRSLEGQRNALVQIGSLLIIKTDGDLVVRNLTQRELAFIQRNPGSAANAKEILNNLQGLGADDLRTAAIVEPAHAGPATLTGRIWTSGELHCLSVTNIGVVPVRNLWAAIEGSSDRDGLRVVEDHMPLSLLLPGQSAMFDIIGNGHPRPVKVALRAEGPVGEAIECVIKVDL